MISEKFQQLENIIDNEIKGYSLIEDFYNRKHDFLVKGDTENLVNIDSEITATIKKINDYTKNRVEISAELGNPNLNISQIIGLVKPKDQALAKRFEEKKLKLNHLAVKIAEKEKTNIALIKQGLTIVNKNMQIIVDILSPPSESYDKSGKNIKRDDMQISSIIEEC